jgi:hypothetical protein
MRKRNAGDVHDIAYSASGKLNCHGLVHVEFRVLAIDIYIYSV